MDKNLKVAERDTSYITMVDRAFAILDYIYKCGRSVGISEISRELDIPKANTFRIIKTLEKWSAVERDEDEKLFLGKILIKYGDKSKESIDIISSCTPYMRSLANEIGETVNLGIKHENNILIIHTEEGEASILVSRLVPISPMYCSSIGKTFLANMDNNDICMYFENEILNARTINTITTKEQFMKEKENILNSNIAYDNEEYEYGLMCLSSPIYNKEKDVIAGLSISGPKSRLEFKGLEKIEKHLIDATKNITNSLEIL
ncbi:IclR family transcriptional regulator [Terrisporobacter hibernicus]|uniref:IclR family transcriptional regulator n=1 Tax=Terrisporobacter hibernicus TaxID=2813371 RepID=A0AAX2ZNH3_9FIRM|nr:IclR family transcriptional regulator [Terrisporobacter hibernicus]UEL49132.1 IclR family transcriptional regulator [Terrisporobacter hibernicus]UPA30879.1 IclR family transcriptional regulator [Terrisporobacter glycolicus]